MTDQKAAYPKAARRCRCIADGHRCHVTEDRFPLNVDGVCSACAKHHAGGDRA